VKRLVILTLLAACGDNVHLPPMFYHAPPDGGKLRLVRDDAASTGTSLVLDFVVGDQPLTGYSTGFDIRVDASKMTVGAFTPGTPLDLGTGTPAAKAAIGTTPNGSQLVAVQSQKATSSPADATLAPGALLFTLQLDAVEPLVTGVIFDGATDVTSAGLRDRSGTTVVDTADVAIGKLEMIAPP